MRTPLRAWLIEAKREARTWDWVAIGSLVAAWVVVFLRVAGRI